MRLHAFLFLWLILATAFISAEPQESIAPEAEDIPSVSGIDLSTSNDPEDRDVSVFLIPIEGEIGPALLFVLRWGLKEAIELGADVLVIEMNTPDGRLDVTFAHLALMS